MKKIRLASSILIGTITLSSLSAPLNASAAEQNISSTISSTDQQNTYSDIKQVKEIKGFTNQQLFDELENQGYELTDIFTEEEIEMYQSKDNLRAGNTQFVTHTDGSATLYLSSAYTKVIKVLGSGAAGTIGALVGSVASPVGSAALAGILGGMVSEGIDSSRGVYITFAQDPNNIFYPRTWGYQ